MSAQGDTLREAATAVAARGSEVYPPDIFGDSLTSYEWGRVRAEIASVPVTIDRISADICRRAYAAVAVYLRDLAADADDEETP